MNINQIAALVRSLLLAVGAVLVTRGTLTDGQLQEIVGATISLGVILWSQFYHSKNPSVTQLAKDGSITPTQAASLTQTPFPPKAP